METVVVIVVALCVVAFGAYLIECLFTGAEFLLRCASELGFIGEIAFWLAWILFVPALFGASLVCGFLL